MFITTNKIFVPSNGFVNLITSIIFKMHSNLPQKQKGAAVFTRAGLPDETFVAFIVVFVPKLYFRIIIFPLYNACGGFLFRFSRLLIDGRLAHIRYVHRPALCNENLQRIGNKFVWRTTRYYFIIWTLSVRNNDEN